MEAYFGLFLKEEPILVFLVASLGDWQRDCQKSDPKVVFRADGSLSMEAE